MYFIGLAGWSSRRSWGRGEHQSSTSRGQTHRRFMRRPQREGWHPALHQWDRGPHCQTCGATQAVRFPSSDTRMTSNALWILRVILRRSFCRLKLQPHANSWHILPAWKICCCLSTLGISPTIRFLTLWIWCDGVVVFMWGSVRVWGSKLSRL